MGSGMTKAEKKAQREKSKDQQKVGRRRQFIDCTEKKVRRTLKSNGSNGVGQLILTAKVEHKDQLADGIRSALGRIGREEGLLAEKAREVLNFDWMKK